MGHDVRDRLTDYWAKVKQLYTPFCSTTVKRDRFLHIPHFLHFQKKKEIYKNDQNYDRLWKMRDICEIISNAYVKYYNPSEHLAREEAIVLFKGRVVFKQYIKKNKYFGIRIFKLCALTG
jgi:hypothetical protein